MYFMSARFFLRRQLGLTTYKKEMLRLTIGPVFTNTSEDGRINTY